MGRKLQLRGSGHNGVATLKYVDTLNWFLVTLASLIRLLSDFFNEKVNVYRDSNIEGVVNILNF